MIKESLGRKSFSSQTRLLLAMAKKDFLHWKRYPTWVLFITIFPILFVARFVYMGRMFAGPEGNLLGPFTGQTGTDDFVSFMILSGCLMFWLMHVLWGIGQVIRHEQLQGTLVQNWLCPVSRFRWLVGSTLFDLILMLVIIGLIIIQGWFFWGFKVRGDIWLAALIMVLTLCALHGFAFVFAGLVIAFKEPYVLNEVVGSLLLILCGIVYPISILPEWIQKISLLIPLTWAAKDIRAVLLLGENFSAISRDVAMLLGSAIVFPLFGYLVFIFIEGRSRATGSLGKY